MPGACYTDQTGPRGDDKLYVQSMAMADGRDAVRRRPAAAAGDVERRAADGGARLPNLFATGETADGEPLVDRQHPHDLFMELAARRRHRHRRRRPRAFLYGGPVGEPALGPQRVHAPRLARGYNPGSADHPPLVRFDAHHLRRGHRRRRRAGVAARGLAPSAGASPTRTAGTSRRPSSTAGACGRRFDALAATGRCRSAMAGSRSPRRCIPARTRQRTTASVHYNSGSGLVGDGGVLAKNRLPGRHADRLAGRGELGPDRPPHAVRPGRERRQRRAVSRPRPSAARPGVPRHQAPGGLCLHGCRSGRSELALGGTVAKFFKPDALDPYYGEDPMGYTLFAKLSLGR